jgi:hypothetical protein
LVAGFDAGFPAGVAEIGLGNGFPLPVTGRGFATASGFAVG